MAWTNAWDETAPAGSALRSTLDDIIRALKVDIRERMDTILDPATQWEGSTNPLQLLPPTINIVRTLIIPCSALQPGQDEDDISYTSFYTESDNAGTNDMRMGIPLQTGWVVQTVEVLFNLNTDTQADIQFGKISFTTTPASTIIDSQTVLVAGITNVLIFTGSEPVTGGYYYHITINGNDAGRWRAYAVRITYNEAIS